MGAPSRHAYDVYNIIVFKVVLVGDAKVGKTSLLLNWAAPGEFSEYYEPTVSPEITTKDLVVGDRTVRLQVWDTGFGDASAGTQFRRFVDGAAGAVLAYDLSDPASVDGVAHWHEQVRGIAGPYCLFAVAGCKSDLPAAPGVGRRAHDFCVSVGAESMHVSATRSNNAASVFQALARRLLQQVQQANAPSNPTATADKPSAVLRIRSAPVLSLPAVKNGGGCNNSGAVRESGRDIGGGPGSGEEKASFGSIKPSIIKLVVVGDTGVGKSCLSLRLIGEQEMPFLEEHVSTAGPEISTLFIPSATQPVLLQIWDASGEDLMYNPKVSVPVLQDANAVAIVYDVTARSSFEHVKQWLELVKARAGPEAAMLVIGNKTDAPGRAVSTEQGQSKCQVLRLPFLEFSAKCLTDVTEILLTLLGSKQLSQPSIHSPAPSSSPAPSEDGDSKLPRFGTSSPPGSSSETGRLPPQLPKAAESLPGSGTHVPATVAPRQKSSMPETADKLSLRQKLYDSIKRVKAHIEERAPDAMPDPRPQEPLSGAGLQEPCQGDALPRCKGMPSSADSLSKHMGWEPDGEPDEEQSPARIRPSMSSGSSLDSSVGARAPRPPVQFAPLAAQMAQRLGDQSSVEGLAKRRASFQTPRDASGRVDFIKLKEILSRQHVTVPNCMSTVSTGASSSTSSLPGSENFGDRIGAAFQMPHASRSLRHVSETNIERVLPQSPST
eukprot:gnl/TRDRNA2_/TRDRNA2_110670_c0_seq1.p1 gnl/TRDRNA2_/TRDRNA2_110670_c0~~gnl/TRDRNA2_/TRDRNA2_110670_c0_seq1.p1  ORF type:complete len:720 (+),score=108.47 gnl/TRDRNA2_/TRDRNA2_110670_c0_seq1:108-2267(+)